MRIFELLYICELQTVGSMTDLEGRDRLQLWLSYVVERNIPNRNQEAREWFEGSVLNKNIVMG
jgi:hypothetical protein